MMSRPAFRPDRLAPVISAYAAGVITSGFPRYKIIENLRAVNAPAEAFQEALAGWDALYTRAKLAGELDRYEADAPATVQPPASEDAPAPPLTPQQAAEILDMTAHRVRQLVRTGHLQRVSPEGARHVLIDPESVTQEALRRGLENEQFSDHEDNNAA